MYWDAIANGATSRFVTAQMRIYSFATDESDHFARKIYSLQSWQLTPSISNAYSIDDVANTGYRIFYFQLNG